MIPRAATTRWLWWSLWGCALLLLALEALDAWQRSAPLPVWLIKLLPLAVVLPAVLRDRLSSVIWVCLVSLLYFVVAVQRVFAEPGSPRAVLELVAVIGLFLAGMFYTRFRARELRRDIPEDTA